MPFMEAAGRRLEYERAGPKPGDAPTLAFPRQGLGPLSMWRGRTVGYMRDVALHFLPEVGAA